MDITLPLHAEEGMRAQLEHALASHGLHGRSFRIGDAADPLPGPLLSALRLQCMTPAELYLHCVRSSHMSLSFERESTSGVRVRNCLRV